MNRFLSATLIGFTAFAIATPAWAGEFIGPRGSQGETRRALDRNSDGGFTGSRDRNIDGAYGGSSRNQGGFQTDGNGNVIYGNERSVTGPEGNYGVESSTTGSGSYDRDTGYTGSSSTTINGQTIERTTEGGTTIIERPRRR